MNLSVEYIDRNGTISHKNILMTRLAFAKHLAIAGQGYAPRPQKFMRTIAMFIHYNYYMQKRAFDNDSFSVPPDQLYDPTEKGQFSNLAGKSIADFLSKKIDKSIFTVNYEAGMKLKGMSLNVKRPDLLAFSQNSIFALEAKGFSNGSGDMKIHKNQSKTGGIKVDFTVACVSHNLYKKINCKYHDPYNDKVTFDFEYFRRLTKKYYSGLSEFLNDKYFDYNKIENNGEDFYTVELSLLKLEEFFRGQYLFPLFNLFEFFDYYKPQIILPSNIKDLAENGMSELTKPFKLKALQNDDIYIDNDRVGIRNRNY